MDESWVGKPGSALSASLPESLLSTTTSADSSLGIPPCCEFADQSAMLISPKKVENLKAVACIRINKHRCSSCTTNAESVRLSHVRSLMTNSLGTLEFWILGLGLMLS